MATEAVARNWIYDGDSSYIAHVAYFFVFFQCCLWLLPPPEYSTSVVPAQMCRLPSSLRQRGDPYYFILPHPRSDLFVLYCVSYHTILQCIPYSSFITSQCLIQYVQHDTLLCVIILDHTLSYFIKSYHTVSHIIPRQASAKRMIVPPFASPHVIPHHF